MISDKRKKIRLKDIADRLGISINAVSLALNNKVGVSDETRLKVLRTANDLGYLDQIKNQNKKNLYNNICVLLGEKIFQDTRFYPKVILGIENEAKKNKFDTIINFIGKDSFNVPSSIEKGKVDGILVLGYIDDQYLSLLKSFRIPLILVDYASLSVNTGAVLTQNTPGTFMATKYLIENGHREIGFFGDKDATMSFNERWHGFRMALKHSNIQFKKEYCLTNSIDENAINNNYLPIVERLNKMELFPTAWVCANDTAASLLISALRHMGKNVPGDVSVIGFDDIDLCRLLNPALTTIRVDMEKMGSFAVKELIESIENPVEVYRHIRISVKLIERDSVKTIKPY
jgi:DNA-binding LacI/PurR family transcriptional regulator